MQIATVTTLSWKIGVDAREKSAHRIQALFGFPRDDAALRVVCRRFEFEVPEMHDLRSIQVLEIEERSSMIFQRDRHTLSLRAC